MYEIQGLQKMTHLQSMGQGWGSVSVWCDNLSVIVSKNWKKNLENDFKSMHCQASVYVCMCVYPLKLISWPFGIDVQRRAELGGE